MVVPEVVVTRQASPEQQFASVVQAALDEPHAFSQVPLDPQTWVASQQGTVDEQVWPRLEHVETAVWHVPLVAPAAIWQAVPEQQSRSTVHDPPLATHEEPQVPLLQLPLQHCAPEVQACPSALHWAPLGAVQVPFRQYAEQH